MMRLIRTRLRRRRREETGQAVILLYHSISRGRPDPWRLCVAPDLFAEQMQLLRDRFRVVALGELHRALSAGKPLSGAVVITFDDGYRDNLLVAKPLLERHGLPATVFVATAYVGASRDFWWDELETLCAAAGLESRSLWDELQPLTHEDRFDRLDRLWAANDVARLESSLPLSPAELERLAEGTVIEVGAHTVTHPHLSSLPVARQRVEIEASRDYLAEAVGRPVETFSYPHGDFSAQTVDVVRSAGFRAACTTRSAPVPRRRAQPLALPRLQVGNWDAEALERELDRRLA
jgi:peptidoglycan/xylan/chitin deacetylase (PgdA/CDA1 family)